MYPVFQFGAFWDNLDFPSVGFEMGKGSLDHCAESFQVDLLHEWKHLKGVSSTVCRGLP